MVDRGRELEELLTLISQSKRLLVYLYEGYFSSRPLAYVEALGMLAEDSGRLQSLLEKEIISLADEGIRLDARWMTFLENVLLEKESLSISTLREKLNQAKMVMAAESSPASVEKSILLLKSIHLEWEKIDIQENKDSIHIAKEQWRELVWKQLKKYWGLKESWDKLIAECWEEAEAIEHKMEQPSQFPPTFIQNLLHKKRATPNQLWGSLEQFFSSEKALFWAATPPRSTRVNLTFFEQRQGKLSASKIRGKKKIELNIDLSPKETILPPSDELEFVEELMRDFFLQEMDLLSYVKQHPSTTELSEDKQLETFWHCLFRYEDKLSRTGRKHYKWVKKKE